MQQAQKNKVQRLQVCGSGGSGQLLTGNQEDQHQFVEVSLSLNDIQKFKVNGMYGGMIKQDGQLYVWGENYLGSNSQSQTLIHLMPKQVQISQKVKRISCGWSHTLILTEDLLYGLGSNKFFELGLEQSIIFSQPVQINLNSDSLKILKVFAGFRQSFILTDSDKVYGCGSNKFGEVGELEKQVKQFTLLKLPQHVRQIKCGQKYALLLTEQGKLYGWGDNTFGQLGQGKEKKILKATQIAEDVKQFDTGWSHHLILRNNQPFIQITGRGDFGQIGNGSLDHQFQYFQLDNIIENPDQTIRVKAGALSSYVIQQNQIFQTGWNEHGNLNTGDVKNIINWIKLNLLNLDQLIKFKPTGASCYCLFSK